MNQSVTITDGGLKKTATTHSGIKKFLSIHFSGLGNTIGIRRILPKENEAVALFVKNAINRKGGIGQDVLLYDGELADLFGTYTTSSSFFYVMHQKKEILGTIGFRADKRSENSCKIKKFYLAPSFDYGQYRIQLLQAACEKARAMKYEQIVIELGIRESELIFFFEQQGFKVNSTPSGPGLVKLESRL